MVKRSCGSWPSGRARTCRGERLADQSQTARGTRAEEGEDNQKDRLRRTTLQHPRAQALVRTRKNRVAPTDLGHGVQGRVDDPLSVGDRVPRHRVTLGTAEQHEPKQPQQVHLEEPVDYLLLTSSAR
jgi:hypothetical protein